MKKTVILFALAFSFSGIFAQELVSKKGEEFLPKKDDWAISMCADPIFSFVGNMFNGTAGNGTPSASWMNGNQTIVAKKFMEDNQAYRVIVRLGFFIKSAQAKRFRDAAEDLVIRAVEKSVADTLSTDEIVKALIKRGYNSTEKVIEAMLPEDRWGEIAENG